MRFSDWHNATGWRGRSAFLGRRALLLALAALPVYGPLVPLPLAAGILLLLPQALAFGRLRNKVLLLLPMAFYLLHVLGMAWTTDVDFGLFDLEVKLSLLIVPLVAAGLIAPEGRDFLRPAMATFTIGLAVAMVLDTYAALACFMERGWIECFTQSYMSAYMHPSYMAWFACWALFYWGRRLVDGDLAGSRWRWPCIAFLLLLTAYIVMLASKSGLIGLALVLVVLAVHAVRTLPGRTLRWVALGAVITMAVPATLLSHVLYVRVGEAVRAVGSMARHDPEVAKAATSTDERLVAWTCSLQCIAASPWGAGTGDIKHVLMDCYRAKGATAAIDRRLNSHSQPLQSGVALGWPGLLLVCAMMLAPLLAGLRRRDPFLAIFAALFILNGAIESVLEVQAGVVYFILFFVLLAGRPSGHRTDTEFRP